MQASRAPYTSWSDEELDDLRRLAPTMSAPELADRLGRTVDQVRGKAARARVKFGRALSSRAGAAGRWSGHERRPPRVSAPKPPRPAVAKPQPDPLARKSDAVLLDALGAMAAGAGAEWVRKRWRLSDVQYQALVPLLDD